MNKKYMAFGLFAMFALTMVSALVVDYLSNTAEIEMDVNSPMSVAFSDGGEWTDNLILPGTTGLSTVDFNMNVVNLANNEIIAPNVIVTLSDGKGTTTCNDLTSIKFTDTWCHGDGLGECPEQELIDAGLCAVEDGDAVYTIPTQKYVVGQDTTYPVEITFNNVEPSTYTITGIMKVSE